MTKRQAKKIQRRLREDPEAAERYRWTTLRAAVANGWRSWIRYGLERYRWTTLKAVGSKGWRSWIRYGHSYRSRTTGWRWGRWDPARPTPPCELPF